MSASDPGVLDTRDMLGVHRAINGALSTASSSISGSTAGDRDRAALLGSFLAEALWLVHAHHDGEDALLYPLLSERVPDGASLFSSMEAQHLDVSARVSEAERANEAFTSSAAADDAAAVVAALAALRPVVADHATKEEEDVLPIVAQVITPEEWGALPIHAMSTYRGSRMWLPLGLVFEAMPDDIQATMLAHMPPPVVAMITGDGAAQFQAEMKAVQG